MNIKELAHRQCGTNNSTKVNMFEASCETRCPNVLEYFNNGVLSNKLLDADSGDCNIFS